MGGINAGFIEEDSLDLLLSVPLLSPVSLLSLLLLRVGEFIRPFSEGIYSMCWGMGGRADAEGTAPRPMEVGLKVWVTWVRITWGCGFKMLT